MQTVRAGLARGVEQEVIITPIAQPEKPLRNPGHERKHQPDLDTEDDVENNAELRGHNGRRMLKGDAETVNLRF